MIDLDSFIICLIIYCLIIIILIIYELVEYQLQRIYNKLKLLKRT
jgi:hypothetical protein